MVYILISGIDQIYNFLNVYILHREHATKPLTRSKFYYTLSHDLLTQTISEQDSVPRTPRKRYRADNVPTKKKQVQFRCDFCVTRVKCSNSCEKCATKICKNHLITICQNCADL